MVAFGSALLRSQRSGWEEAYVDYDGLKALVRDDPTAFDEKLRYEIEKVSLFALTRLGEIARAIGALRLSKQNQSSSLFGNYNNNYNNNNNQGVDLVPSGEQPTLPVANAYTQCAVELLHWQRFVCINAVGIRKILKKYRKHHPQRSLFMVNGQHDELGMTTTTSTLTLA